MMRILIVNNFGFVTGGADLHCLEITEGLRARGHEVQWLCTGSAENRVDEGAFVRLAVEAGNRDQLGLWAQLDVARRAIWNPDAAGAMKQLLRTFQPDVVHVHKCYVQLSVAPVVIADRSEVPVVQTVHDYEFLSASPLDETGGRWDHDETKFSYRALNSATFLVRSKVHRPRITRWIAVSDSVSRSYRSIGGIECTVIPNFTEYRDEEVRPLSDRKAMLYLGRLSHEKGIADILDVARRMPDMDFVLAGDGPMRAEVEENAASRRNVTYEGFVGRARGRELMRGARACLMPSLWQEPGPLSCLEAMAVGTPVICYPNGGLAEYVLASGAGVVCEKPGPDHLAEAISSVLADSLAWNEYSAGGRQGIRDRHSLTVYLTALESVYNSAVGQAMG